MDRAIRHLPASFDQIGDALAGRPITCRPTVTSLFSGCGGMDLGFLGGFKFMDRIYDKTPFNVVWSNDIDFEAHRTYRHNLQHEILCKDIADVTITSLPTADVVIGGFPCQDFSVAGKRRGLNSARGRLYHFMVNAVNHCRPKIFVAENVKGLLSIPGALDAIRLDFAKSGYEVEWRLLNARDYMVPQNREPGLYRWH